MSNFVLKKADALEILPKMKEGSVDLIIIDIAYESLELHRARGTTTRLKNSDSSSNEWFDTFPDWKIPRLFELLFRVLKKNSYMFFFCDEITMDVVKHQQGISHPGTRMSDGSRKCASGFKYWKFINWTKTTLDGEKVRGGNGYHFQAATEKVMLFEKGKRRLRKTGPDGIYLPAEETSKTLFNPGEGTITVGEGHQMSALPGDIPAARVRGYPTEKPTALTDIFVQAATDPAEETGPATILDTFCGSSPVGESALRFGHKYIGIDISEKAIEVSRARLTVFEEEMKNGPVQLEIPE
jgi:site-specific DNA-methyltransferase (adenine-specific)